MTIQSNYTRAIPLLGIKLDVACTVGEIMRGCGIIADDRFHLFSGYY